MPMHDITPETFIETLFPGDILLPDEIPLMAHPASFKNEEGRTIDYYKQIRGTPRNAKSAGRKPEGWLFCVSTVVEPGDAKIRRRFEDVRTAFVMVMDDIGTKAKENPVPPSYILETSPGNYQWGYLLEPFDVSRPKGQDYYDNAMVCAARAGLTDPGMRSATRVAKMPGAVHRTGFITQCTLWEPDRVWELKDLMKAMGVEVVQVRRPRGAIKPGQFAELDDVTDINFLWMKDNWPIYGHNDQWVYIQCPWHENHSEGTGGMSSTAYSPEDYNSSATAFKCLHGHCQNVGTAEFHTWAHRARITGEF